MTEAIDAGFGDDRSLDKALADYERQRNDGVMPMSISSLLLKTCLFTMTVMLLAAKKPVRLIAKSLSGCRVP